MKRANFLLVLHTFNKRRPFRPYTIELISGARLEINHPEAVEPKEELIVVQTSRGFRTVFEYGSVVRFLDMTGMT